MTSKNKVGRRPKPFCPKGHPYDRIDSRGKRVCIICGNENQRRYEAKKRAKAKAEAVAMLAEK